MTSPTLSPAPAPESRSTALAGTRRSLPRWLDPVLGIAAVLVLLELLPRSGAIDPRYFPPVSVSVGRLLEEVLGARFWYDLALTLQGWALGLAVATVVGVVVGVAAGLSDPVFHAIRPIVEFLRPVPSVALVPLAILVLGAGLESKVFLAAFASTWPILIHAMYGVRDVEAVQLDTSRSYRIRRRDRVLRIVLPNAVPYLATGLRISSAISLALAVTAELIIGAPGLGQTINVARTGGASSLMYALIIATGLLGWLLNHLFTLLERRVLAWHPSQREVAA